MMNIKSNRWKVGVPVALVIAVGAGWFVYSQMQPNTEHQVAGRSATDQELVDRIKDMPEQFDSVIESSEQPGLKPELPRKIDTSVTAVVGEINSSETAVNVDTYSPVTRPNMLSAVDKSTLHRPQGEPVSAENLYFWKDYDSMRKDAVSNPDSPENRAGVVALMQARQKRLGQNQ